MSGQALVWAANVRGLKPATKIVLIQLSDRHNKDSGLCNPSIKTLAEDCEMDRTTVMRHIEVLVSLGLISRSSTGKDDGGRGNNEYVLHMPILAPTDVSGGVKSQNTTGVKSHFTTTQSDFATGVKSQSDGGLSRNPTGVKSHSCATLTLREPVREPEEEDLFGSNEPQSPRDALPASEQAADDPFTEFWAAFPKAPRKTDKPKAKAAFDRIVAGKAKGIGRVPAEIIIAAIRRYAASGPDPEYVPLPTTWLNGARWEQWPEPAPKPRHTAYRSPVDWMNEAARRDPCPDVRGTA